MIKRAIILFLSLECCILQFSFAQRVTNNLADEVCMFMGVRGLSNCVIGPQLPHGSINPSPQTSQGGHGGYKEGQPIRGFGQLHASGTGWGRYGQILLSPQRGFCADEAGHDSEKANEKATPYYYSVLLTRYGIRAEVTPAHHSAVYRFTPVSDVATEKEDMTLLLDIAHSIPRDIAPEQHGKFCGGAVEYDPQNRMLVGWGEYIGGFGSLKPYKVYFAIASQDYDLQHFAQGGDNAHQIYARLNPIHPHQPCEVRVAVSLRSCENACKYLREEVLSMSFDAVCQAALHQWNTTLSAITIEGASAKERSLFYTTLYHSFVMPRDRQNDNPRFDGENIDDHYCVWDTWRTCYPLMTLLNESFVAKTIRSFINRYENDGECTPSFTSSMEFEMRQGGDDVENVIADAMIKGVKGFDYAQAAKWVKWSALHNRSTEYQQYGWQPETDTIMLCSNALEYAYNDWCAMQTALVVGDKSFAKTMKKRSASWKKMFNRNIESGGYRGFIGPHRLSGAWEPIDPTHVYGSWVEYFYEGNSWTYTHFVPHDFDGLVKKCGGKRIMADRLKYGFDHDLIALWNEPGFLSPFIFSHCNRPDLTAKYVSQLRSKNYSIERGYCENEDSGAMGSWFVFTSMGFFPNAGQDFYYLLPPAYPSITLTTEAGKKIYITRSGTPNGSFPRVYLNGKQLKDYIVRHQDIKDGCTLRFEY